VDFVDIEKARYRLDQNGIKFVGKKLLRKHLAVVATTAKLDARRKRR